MAYNAYNPNYNNNVSSMALPGYGSRGKATGLKRLSVAAQPSVASISEHEVDALPTPRTSRSHLLAGLRTQPKTPSVPASAPYYQTQHTVGKAAYNAPTGYQSAGVPHTAVGATFPTQQYAMNPGQQFYALPEQVLAPPPMEIEEAEQMENMYLAQLAAQQQSLNLRAQMLQQQLATLTLLNQQQQAMPQTPMAAQLGLYQQQLMNGMAPLTQEIQPGVYAVFNPLTQQYTYAIDDNVAVASQSPVQAPIRAPAQTTSPVAQLPRHDSPFNRSMSPPKKTPSPPQELSRGPLTGDFRRGHIKNVASLKLSNTPVADGPKSAFVRPVGLPATPMTGTFGPGQGRAGEHPVRQPRGPPALDELKAKPTTLHEGSKNFATRQRRKALSSLVRAGLERRVRPGSGSQGSMTPVSETEMTFSVPSDNDSDSGRSLSSKRSIGSLRAAASGAIGSERKASKEELKIQKEIEIPVVRRRTPLLALANAAEKRRSIVV